MSKFPNSPILQKAAIIIFERLNPLPSVVTFQFNPENMTRDLKANVAEGGGGAEAFRISGAPTETIKMDCIFDSIDRSAEGDKITQTHGVRADLAALEMLIYPTSQSVIANTILLNIGTIEILPASAPFTVLVFGRRVLPVRMSGFSVTEESFDEDLNPIRAKIALDMSVLSYTDLEQKHPGYSMYLGHQIVQESLAQLSRSTKISSILSQKLNAF